MPNTQHRGGRKPLPDAQRKKRRVLYLTDREFETLQKAIDRFTEETTTMQHIPPLTITVDPRELTPSARNMIAAMGRNPDSRSFCVRGISHPHPTISLRSNISFAERVRRFGVCGRIFTPGEELENYIRIQERAYGETLENQLFHWTLPANGVGGIDQSDGYPGANWLNAKAEEFAIFCEKGFFTLSKEINVNDNI